MPDLPYQGKSIRTADWLPDVEMIVDTAIHASGDLLAQPVEIKHAVKEKGVSVVASVEIIDYDDQGADLSLLFFGENPGSLGTLNAAMAINDPTATKCLGFITVDSWLDIGAQQLGTETLTTLAVRSTDDDASIWVAAISGGTGTYATGKLLLRLGLLRG
jgi:hypothetical protein